MAMMSDSHNAFADVSGPSRIQDVHSAVLAISPWKRPEFRGMTGRFLHLTK